MYTSPSISHLDFMDPNVSHPHLINLNVLLCNSAFKIILKASTTKTEKLKKSDVI